MRLELDSWTPWGPADRVKTLADGVWWVGTPGHGGAKVDAKRNAEVRAWLKANGYPVERIELRPGWYEEDCAWAAVAATFPELFVREGCTRDEERAIAVSVLDRWWPKDGAKVVPAWG